MLLFRVAGQPRLFHERNAFATGDIEALYYNTPSWKEALVLAKAWHQLAGLQSKARALV